MPKRFNFLSGVAISLCLAMPALADDAPNAKTIVATVNGTDITLGHMILVRSGLSDQYANLPIEVLYRGILDQLIQQTLLSQALEGAAPARIVLALENERRTLLAAEVISGVIEDAVTEDAVNAAYEEAYAGTEPEREYRAAHILVAEEDIELANDLITQLADGADFSNLAKEHSTGPSGPNGGELGWFGVGTMVKPFEEAIVGMDVGKVSVPVQTQFGWHVIKLLESRLKEAPALKDVRAALEEDIQKQAVEDRIAKMMETAEIVQPEDGTFDPVLLTKTELLGE